MAVEEIREILGEAGDLLFPTEKRSQRPVISYEISEGSVRHRFRTLMQTVIGFGAVIAQIGHERNIDFLHEKTAAAIESLQHMAREKDYVITLLANQQSLRIDSTTHYQRQEQVWAEAEFYLYGELTNAGGKNNPNIHLDTKEHGTLRIAVDKDILKQGQKNLLYRKFGVRAAGRQNLKTFEMDPNSLRFVEMFDHDSDYSQPYLDALLQRASRAWAEVTDPDVWLEELRGGGMPKTRAANHGVLCDTSYFIRWAKPGEALHSAAHEYLRFLVEGGHELYVSTIALAEYAVRDSITNLPLRYFRVLPFNIDHAQRAGEFARSVFEARRNLNVQVEQRAVSQMTRNCLLRLIRFLRSPTI